MSQKFRQDSPGNYSAPCGTDWAVWWFSAGSSSGLNGSERIPSLSGTSMGRAGRLVSAVPLSFLNGLRDSPGGVACRAVGLLTVVAQGSESECAGGKKGQLEVWAWKLSLRYSPRPQTAGQSGHRACPDSASPRTGRVSKNL